MLIVISAPSGAGKTTIVKELLTKNPEYIFSISATTRSKRNGEIEGKDYFYLTKEEFEKKISDDELIEYECLFNKEYYGTLKSSVDENLQNKKTVLFDVDVNGALSIKKKYPQDSILLFIEPPNLAALKERLSARATESKEQIEERMKRVDLEVKKKSEFDYIVVNDRLDRAVEEIQKIINQKVIEKER